MEGKKIAFEQNAGNVFQGLPMGTTGRYYFLFGPGRGA